MTRSSLFAGITIGAVVLIAVLALRATGLLQGLELLTYDHYLRFSVQPSAPNSRILILEITEDDIREQGHWPLSDRTLTSALRALVDNGARAVGLDIYRDLPVPPGDQQLVALLQSQPRIVAVEKFADEHSEGIPGPSVLEGTERIGFNDIIVDQDGAVRRGLLFLDNGEDEVAFSFALRLALLYLADEGVYPLADPAKPDWLRLGPTTLPPFDGNDGGYSGEDDAGYQFLLDFSDGMGGFESIALGTLLRGQVDPGRIRDRIVLVGVTAESLPDFHHVALSGGGDSEIGIPGVELHAHAVSQLVRHGLGESRHLRVLPDWQEALLVLLFAVLGCTLGIRLRGVFVSVLSALCGLAMVWLLGALSFRAGCWIPIVSPAIAWVSAGGIVTAWSSNREKTQRNLLMQLFSRHVSTEVADQIWRERNEFLAGGRPRARRLVATVLFLDMKGYTPQAEKMDPERLMDWVNRFMELMAQKVADCGGIVDDYFGDGLKANFGPPFPRTSEAEIAEDAQRAVRCGLAMEEALHSLNAQYRRRGFPPVTMRVGIHTGPVVAGSMGSASRLKYTVVGDVVVTAQRLESLNPVEHDFDAHPCRILISGQTQTYLDQSFQVDALGQFSLKGKAEQVTVYRVLRRDD
jgi:adenylate cyclase